MMKKLFAATILFIGFLFISFTTSAQYTKLLDFDGINGQSAYGNLVSDGTFLYGMTQLGGANSKGVIFRIKSDGTDYTNLLDFNGTDNGAYPLGSLVLDGTYLYGMTLQGGTNNKGVVFKIKLDGTNFSKLLDFEGINGQAPNGALIIDGEYLYGMTNKGGVNNKGVVFKIKLDGADYTNLLDFDGGNNGESPNGSLISDGEYLYGMTSKGGLIDFGVIFKIKLDGSDYVKLLDFDGTNNGQNPLGSLISDGTYFYGMTAYGGVNNWGVIFKIKPDGTDYTNLLDFNGLNNGQNPNGSLILSGSHLYGMTLVGGLNNNGLMFKIKPDGTNYSKLMDFGGSDGYSPSSSLISDGANLYGMTKEGGANNKGVVFKYNHCTPSARTDVQTACNSYTWPLNNKTYTESTNTAKVTLINAVGCDSVVTLNLTIEPSDITIDNSLSPTLKANQAGATYQWIDCNNGNTPIVGETGQSFTATNTGNYAVEITVDSCTQTSFCESVTVVGIKEQVENTISIYPNPTSGLITVDLGNNSSLVSYKITTIDGKMVEAGYTSNNLISIDLGNESRGVYFISIHQADSENVFKVVKQ